jgi:hypothetical protein
VGDAALDDARRPFAPHSAYERQLAWHLDGVERYLKRET